MNWTGQNLGQNFIGAIKGVTYVDENGCEREDDILINVLKDREVYIPNAFSPNGDGVNDGFTVFAGSQVLRVKNLKIYNRWGEVVFENFN